MHTEASVAADWIHSTTESQVLAYVRTFEAETVLCVINLAQ